MLITASNKKDLMDMDKARIKKIGNITLNVILYIFLVLCLISVVMTVFSRKDSDGAAEVLGYQFRVVTTDSMAKSEHTDVSEYDIKDIPSRSLVIVKVMPEDEAKANEWYGTIRKGDVLTFRYVYNSQVTITHRVKWVQKNADGGYIIELEGDNKSSEDGQLVQTIDTSIPNNPNYVIGKVVGKAYLIGVILSFLMQPVGIVLVIIVPCVIIIFFEIMKIAKVMSAEKKGKAEEESARKDSELEELRRRLKELEDAQGGAKND